MTIRFLVISLTKALLPRLLRLASSWRSLDESKLLPFRIYEATVFLETFNAADIFWYPFPDLCLNTVLSRSSTDKYPSSKYPSKVNRVFMCFNSQQTEHSYVHCMLLHKSKNPTRQISGLGRLVNVLQQDQVRTQRFQGTSFVFK